MFSRHRIENKRSYEGPSAVPHERDRRVLDDAACGQVADPVSVAPFVLGIRCPPELGSWDTGDGRDRRERSDQKMVDGVASGRRGRNQKVVR